MSLALRLEGIQKSYGSVHALRGATFRVSAGAITALIGPNGAGKTTLFSIACGYCSADAGIVEVLGGAPSPARLSGRLSALPQDAFLSRDLSVRDQLTYLALLGGVASNQAASDVQRVLALVGLEQMIDRRVSEMSHGQAKRIGVAQAFLGTPELILLDEPTAGLDPRNAAELRDVIRQARGQRSVVVSSHNLQELEEMCDEATFIEAGQTVDSGKMTELTDEDSQIAVTLGRALDAAALAAIGAAFALTGIKLEVGNTNTNANTNTLIARFAPVAGEIPEDAISRILLALLQGGAKISKVERGRSLEQTYLAATQGK